MTGSTGFFHDERCLWHGGGNFALTVPVGGLVQPLAAGGLPEGPEAKRRLVSLLTVTGLMADLVESTAPPAPREALERVHTPAYLDAFKALSDAGGGELGLRTPFGPGGYDIAALSAGLAMAAVRQVASGALANAYALSRPPGHHCLPDWPNGFCLLNNIAIAVEAARAEGLVNRVAILDWDVHHGNGTEAIYLADGDVLTVSIHQDRNYPLDTGGPDVRGEGAGLGANLNIPLPPGAGHATWVKAVENHALPRVEAFQPDMIVVASGYDASGVDPLSRMLCSANTFETMTRATMAAAERVAGGRLVLVHEGGYSEVHAPFCAHAAIATLARSSKTADDPLAARIEAQQPSPEVTAFFDQQLEALRTTWDG